MSTSTFSEPASQQFNVFNVTQLTPDSFLESTLGLDIVRIAPNSTSEIHRHNASDNLVYILDGAGAVSLDGVVTPIHPRMRILIPRGVAHGFKSSSAELVFLSAQVPPILDEKTGVFDREVIVASGEW
jgi:quercetin dioxygenase-like cupin family protein